MEPRRGRGRISELERLPAWADEAKLVASQALKERKLTQLEILEQFNEALKVAAWENGVTEAPQISRSAFNRNAMRISIMGRRMEETIAIAKVVATKLDKAADDQVTVLIAESIKMLAHEMLSNAGELEADGPTAQMLMFTARALKDAESAKRISSDGRVKLEKEFQSKTAAAVDQVAKAEGWSKETVESIKATVLGMAQVEKKAA